MATHWVAATPCSPLFKLPREVGRYANFGNLLTMLHFVYWKFFALSGSKLPGEMGKSFVGFCHTMRCFFFGDSDALTFVRGFDLGEK